MQALRRRFTGSPGQGGRKEKRAGETEQDGQGKQEGACRETEQDSLTRKPELQLREQG